MKSEKKGGPKRLPCGTPACLSNGAEIAPLSKATTCERPDKKDSI